MSRHLLEGGRHIDEFVVMNYAHLKSHSKSKGVVRMWQWLGYEKAQNILELSSLTFCVSQLGSQL